MKVLRFGFVFFLLVALFLAFAAPTLAHAMGLSQAETPPFEAPDALKIALAGFLAYWITEGLKLLFPALSGYGTRFASLIASFLLDVLVGLITTNVPSGYFPIITQLLILLSTWLVSQGTKRIEKSIRSSIAFRAAQYITKKE